MELRIQRLDKDLPLPSYAREGDAGLDLLAAEEVTLAPGERRAVPTGIAVAIPNGYAGFVHARSGRSLREGLALVNAPGLIDSGYRGEHTCFNQAVAATGRLSSSDPNLQNIPIRTELGREIRRAFIAAPDHVLISADYSQIELRVLAHMAGEEALIEAFRTGEDIHERTGLKLFGPDSGLDRHVLRSRSKMVNYAVLYGKKPFTLSRAITVKW